MRYRGNRRTQRDELESTWSVYEPLAGRGPITKQGMAEAVELRDGAATGAPPSPGASSDVEPEKDGGCTSKGDEQ